MDFTWQDNNAKNITIRRLECMTNIKVNVRWMDGYYESFDL